MKRTKAEAAATRQAILDAALQVFSRRGFSAAGLEEIARAAGVTRGAVYWHFKNKLDLYTQLIEQSYTRVAAAESAILESDLSPLAKLRTLMLAYLVHLADDDWFRAVEKVSVFNVGTTVELEPLTRVANQFLREKKQSIAALVAEAVTAEEVRPETEPDVVAAGVVSFLYGIEMSWLSDEELFPLAADAEKLVALFLEGITVPRERP